METLNTLIDALTALSLLIDVVFQTHTALREARRRERPGTAREGD
ncbi:MULTISPECIES: hypothetical protein [unclassified Streptomyces]|nr:hypothetical protein [Streptomyces sp. FL07-04A]MDX3575515.1 hypothetical protein [Streptomyces sp. FL07-04A]